jgi:hypothetical protein
MLAQSPALSPMLTAIVMPLRGSPSGMFCLTMPAKPVPTTAALMEVPPPTRMNVASSAAPKPTTLDVFAVKIPTTIAVPHRPGTTVTIPAKVGPERRLRSQCSPCSRAARLRTLLSTVSRGIRFACCHDNAGPCGGHRLTEGRARS